jgi:CRP/FNR family transcriptional regulator
VRNRAACAVLNDREISHLADIANHIQIEPGQSAFFEGDDALNLFIIIEGAVKLYKLLPDGRRQITGFLFKGDLLGLAFADSYKYTAEAIAPARLCRLPRARVEELLPRLPHLGSRLLNLASSEIATAQDQMLLLGRKHAGEKLASFLLRLAERAESRGETAEPLHLPMTRSDIADYLGLTIETVSREFTKFKKDGLISLDATSDVRLLDRERLAHVAEAD